MWTCARFLGILCLVVSAVTVSPIHSLEEVFGSRSTLQSVVPASTFDPKAICNGTYGTVCGDCSNMILCLGDMPPLVNQCGSQRRYCNKELKQCVSDLPTEQDDCPPKIDFMCLMPGFYPHPTNCSIYYECMENGIVYENECPPGYAWATEGMKCRQKLTTNDCGTVDCISYPDSIQAYSSNSSFYAYCGEIVNGLQKITMVWCHFRNEFYNTVTSDCRFHCPDEGLYADPRSATYYYRCYKSGTNLVYQREQCTGRRVFSEPEQKCK